MELKKAFRLHAACNQHMNASLSVQETKGSISNAWCSTQVYVNSVKICTVIIGHETKALIKLHSCICGILCVKSYYGATNIIIFLPANPGYKLRGKRQVKEACIFCGGSSFCEQKIHTRHVQPPATHKCKPEAGSESGVLAEVGSVMSLPS